MSFTKIKQEHPEVGAAGVTEPALVKMWVSSYYSGASLPEVILPTHLFVKALCSTLSSLLERTAGWELRNLRLVSVCKLQASLGPVSLSVQRGDCSKPASQPFFFSRT